MGDQDDDKPFLGTGAASAADYERAQPSDAVSLSDSDSDDLGLADEAEVDTISPEDSSVDDGDYRSGDPSDNTERSPVQPFHLRGMSSTFSLRSQSIFDCLEEAAKLSVPSMSEDNVVDGRFKRPLPPTTMSSNVVPESLGKPTRPVQAPRMSPAVPDYVAHPERWTKYSLDGVPESGDKTNRAVAMEFLEGLKKREEEQSSAAQDSYTPYFNQDPSSCGAGRIVFTKPAKRGVDGLEKKILAGEGDKKHIKTDLKGKTDDLREEDKVELGHLGGGRKATEEEEGCLMVENLNTEVEHGVGEEPLAEKVGFHCSKKRNRKNFRPKVDDEGEEEE
ncbi:protein TSSC4 [Tympanuchus pallidicinctus]|uniref:protein TSSC4 n=1 Tax=Tympanuchus pallidicinctus TaxID=109042 RepID=UPI0022870E37|nr:protein TSSC4 [Tympanuchus pallidicinctus]XP_052550539.1 protein TSSC4 [Tympanuchus pallidicinctus]XP_052550540.1 protein TSSC4 [Tympanuchus pallidicinctus]XP_052550541.1 protein TSSC4 [Tympanuchus pallidicinctus]